jgi:hypothetical protein
MQQNVVPPVGVTVPVGCPLIGVQLPPLGGDVTDALAEVMLGFIEKAAHVPDVITSSCVSHFGGNVLSLYRVQVTVHESPMAGPHEQGVQLRVSLVPE